MLLPIAFETAMSAQPKLYEKRVRILFDILYFRDDYWYKVTFSDNFQTGNRVRYAISGRYQRQTHYCIRDPKNSS
jgi:hypothetical protein